MGRKESNDPIVAFTTKPHLNGVDAEFGDSVSPSPNGKQHNRTMCILRAYLKGRQDTGVSRQCFTRRLTVGIAKGMPTVTYGHKKTDGSVGGSIMGLPRWSLRSQYTTKVVNCQVFLGSSIRL